MPRQTRCLTLPSGIESLGERKKRAELNAHVAAKSLAIRGVFRGTRTGRSPAGAKAKSPAPTHQSQVPMPPQSESASGSAAMSCSFSLGRALHQEPHGRKYPRASSPIPISTGYDTSGAFSGIGIEEERSGVIRASASMESWPSSGSQGQRSTPSATDVSF